MLERVKKITHNRVKKLQQSDEGTKKRWLVGGSATMMIFIIVLWVFYLNLTLPRLNDSGSANIESVRSIGTADVGNKESVVDVFVRGVKEVAGLTEELWLSVKSKVIKGREIEIIK